MQPIDDHIRVDERLIHGQVLQAWVPVTGITRIIIADDESFRDVLIQTVMKMSAPPGVKIEVTSLDGAADKYAEPNHGVTMIIVKNLPSAEKLVRGGIVPRKVIIGNVHASKERRPITQSVYLSLAELGLWEEMAGIGVRVVVQTVPTVDSLGLDICRQRYYSFH